MAAACSWAGFTDVEEWGEGKWALVNGRIHRISKDLEFSSTVVGYCPMHVTQNVNTVVWIDRGVTLKLRGGNADGRIASCPAIMFDSTDNSMLIIAGHGTLEVTGGNGADGGAGAAGGMNYQSDDDKNDLKCGSGGAGGNGGGAASPGIGGKAGAGGAGAGETTTEYEYCKIHSGWNNVTKAGNKAGSAGSSGGNGTDCGTIYVIGTVTVKAAYGTGGKAGAAGEGGSGNDDAYRDVSSGDDYFTGPGGGGGGGGGGPQPKVAIGGGIGGAGGGGSGASGTTIGTQDWNNKRYREVEVLDWMIGGYGGYGGRSDTSERSSTQGGYGKSLDNVKAYWHSDTITLSDEDEGEFIASRSPYPGGGAGKKGNDGGNGKLYIMSSAKVQNLTAGQSAYSSGSMVTLNESAQMANDFAQLPAGVKYTLYLQNTGSERVSRTVALGCKYPNITIPTREHYTFQGYYEKPNRGGECYYDGSGRWMRGDDFRYYDQFCDQTLYAAWELTGESSESVVVTNGMTLVVDELSGASEYIQDAEEPLFTVLRGGKLVLNNLTFFGDEMSTAGIIRNFGELVVSNCAFSSCYARKGRGGVYRDFPGAQALFIRCSFVSCGALEGGVIAAEGSKVSVLSSTFAYNSSLASISGHTWLGAAIYNDLNADTRVCGCTFVGHTSSASGGTVITYCKDSATTPDGEVINCVFDMDESCKLSIANQPKSCKYNFRTKASKTGDASGDWCKTTDGAVTLASPRKVNGVAQTYFKVTNQLRTLGIAEQIYTKAEWPNYEWKASGGGDLLYDILDEWPLDGYAGARTGNELQRLIDLTPAGGTLTINPRVYDGVVINKMITIIGKNVASTIVSGDSFEPCVQYEAGGENATWVNITFESGYNSDGNGGGWTSANDVDRGIASNCVFQTCKATNGGGAANAKEIADSVFIGCTASGSGGGTYSCAAVYRSYYLGNTASVSGGGAASDLRTYSSLFQQNSAGSGGGGANGDFSFCTFARNSASFENTAGASASRIHGCVFYGHDVPSDGDSTVTESKQLYGSDFVDAKSEGAAANYHLALRNSAGEKLYHENVRLSDYGSGAGIMDFDGLPLVSTHPVSGEKYLYAGCFAFAPFKTSGLVVTGEEESYPDSNAQSSLREAVEAAEEFAPMTNGTMTVTFSPDLFKYDTTVLFPLTGAQIDLCAFTNVTLVVRGPTNAVAVIDGSQSSRAFRVYSQNRVIFENLVFQNCFGDIYGKAPQPGCNGGAVLNCGTAFFSNCVFRANRAGNRYDTPNTEAPIGFGGALSTESGATSTVYAATFAGNRAAKGGAVWTADGGASHIYYSTFAGNIADGDVVTDATGGACAQERKTSGALGSRLWLVNCSLAGNRVTKKAESGGAISGGKSGLVLLNSIVVGNYAANVTNDIAMPTGSSAKFYYTVYGTRTTSPETAIDSMRIAYDDCCSIGGVAYLDAFGITNDEAMVVVTTPQPQSIVPLAKNFDVPATYAWTTDDYSTLGYGSADWVEEALDGGDVFDLLIGGNVRTVNQMGKDQAAAGYMLLGPATLTAGSLRTQDPEEEGGETPTYDDEDQVAETNGVCRLTRIDGSYAYYLSVADAKKHWQAGDSVKIVNQTNDTEQAVLAKELTNSFYKELLSFAKTHDWYTFSYDKETLSEYALTLNETAKPDIKGDFDMVSEKDRVSVRIENTKPNLWYALGRADTPEGPYVCDDWVQADENGTLAGYLTAPKTGSSGFYRVIVAPYVK